MTRNRYLARGVSIDEATIKAAERRFRPIFLTAVTTFLGLGPMIFETNEQALFLVPMAISLGVGTLASSLVVLILVPVSFVILEELKSLKPREEHASKALVLHSAEKPLLSSAKYS